MKSTIFSYALFTKYNQLKFFKNQVAKQTIL